MALASGVIDVLVPWALAIKESIQVLLVQGGALSGTICHGDGVLWAALAILVLRRLKAVVVLVIVLAGTIIQA
jgi:hypothetical protein